MKHIDTSAFSEHAAQYLFGGRALAVEHEGRTLGYYLPVAVASDEARQHAVERLGRAVERLLAESGMTEDELADLFDLNRPFPYGIESEAPAAHASGR